MAGVVRAVYSNHLGYSPLGRRLNPLNVQGGA